MTDTPLTPMEEDDALAAEYVLGVLSLADRAAAEARIKRDPAFAAAVSAWENRLADLNDDFADTPAPNLLPQIEARLFPVAQKPARGWLGWFAGAAAAATLVLAALVLPTAFGTDDAIIATLVTEDNNLNYQVTHDGSRMKVTRVAGVAAPTGQVHELWVIAPGAAPVSLGLLADDAMNVEYPLPPAGWVLAVSVEPAGGSTTGAPTGPIIMTAEIKA